MHKKLRNWVILTFFIGFIFVSFKMTELSANYPIVSDLTLTSEQQIGTAEDKVTITITDANHLDTKVRLPLPTNVVMTATGNEGGTVTYDQAQNQLIIDWENAEIENRFMTIELEILEPGSYSFQASVTREEDTVLSNR
ncbi:adhesive domain-containing protein [Isobaculum melis]|uniref:Putative adhesive domain-containing protein n=1 Tax=Isobaculum melis TaxID=142588 RepID=A0A1H9UGK8_9LACT|nr:hypothetical protein [Isobaculum melis]SES08193.1 hypothetical protein SAMN04488559_1296 [Isobaculum melis]